MVSFPTGALNILSSVYFPIHDSERERERERERGRERGSSLTEMKRCIYEEFRCKSL